MNERHLREKFQKKLSLADLRLKKFTQLQQDNQRKTKLVIDKTSEVMRLREELEGIRDKAKERDHFNNKNKELVTKYYG
jgi:DnaJ-domain-containing protein 1